MARKTKYLITIQEVVDEEDIPFDDHPLAIIDLSLETEEVANSNTWISNEDAMKMIKALEKFTNSVSFTTFCEYRPSVIDLDGNHYPEIDGEKLFLNSRLLQ